MSHYRSRIRSSLRLGFQMDPKFRGVEIVSGWLESIDENALPILAVRLTSERKQSQTRATSDRICEIVVSLRRMGSAQIEDDLDLDSVEIERIVLQSMITQGFGVSLNETSFDINGEGKKRLGSLDMKFEVTAQVTLSQS